MARPAKGERQNRVLLTKNRKYYNTAIYIRLSYSTEYTHSESIENQKEILCEYVNEHKELLLYNIYIDNGMTGTNFERPAFERMMNDVKHGEVNCIVVKDFSRFGRDYVVAGDYIEKIFPFLGVRFISVVDEYDSDNPECNKEQLLVIMKNLMHDVYAQDISKKVRGSYEIRQRKGEFYRTSTIPYGYKEGNKTYEIDEKTANIVRKIFESYERGDTLYSICKMLNDKKIATPKQYKTNRNLYRDNEDGKVWMLSTVKKILMNEVYIGTIVRHKTETNYYKSENTKTINEDNWVKVKGTHPAIVDDNLFAKIQKRLIDEKGVNPRTIQIEDERRRYLFDENIFKGKIFCKECGSSMVRINVERREAGKSYIHKGFACGMHRNNINCCIHKSVIEENELCNIVNMVVNNQAKLIGKLRKRIRDNGSEVFDYMRLKISNIRKNNVDKIEELKSNMLVLLELYHKGELTKEELSLKRNKIINKISILNSSQEVLDKKTRKINNLEKVYRKTMYAWSKNKGNKNLSKEIVTLFVERIEVSDTKEVIIKLDYEDEIREIVGLLQERSL